jgi:hypothetical protein
MEYYSCRAIRSFADGYVYVPASAKRQPELRRFKFYQS